MRKKKQAQGDTFLAEMQNTMKRQVHEASQDLLLDSKNYRGPHIESSQPGTDSDRSHSKNREKPRRVAAAALWRTLLYWDYQQIMVLLPEPRFLLGYRSKLARYSDQKYDQNHP